jgi:DNA-binding ferritin-like protein (Dps family)
MTFALTSIAVAVVAESKENEKLDDGVTCDDGPPQKILSVLDLGQFEVDETITGSTPYWIFLVAGKNDKKQFLKFIKSFDLPEKQKNEWKNVLKKLWKKYPLTLDGDIIVLDLPLKKRENGIILTKEEERVLGKLSNKMAEKMEESGEIKMDGSGYGSIIVQWAGPTHQSITYLASKQEGVPDDYAQIAGDNSVKPDEVGFPIQQITHYFNPDLLTGLAPLGCQMYADNALNYYRNRRWNDAFTEFGYSSHFLADVGNPMHTGAELQQGITDFMQLKIHSAYEDFIKNNWQNMFQSYVDNSGYAITTSSPFHSTTQLAAYSHKYLTELNVHIYWNWIWNGGKFNLNNDARIISITGDCLTTTTRYMRGLVRYLTINGPVHFVITPLPGPHGSISPPYPVDVVYDGAKTFTITPDSGYVIDQVFVNGVSKGAITSYPFTKVRSDHTISAIFKPVVGSKTEWIWSQDGWGDWEHTASWSGTEVGPNSEYGPVMVNGHGEHGTNTNLLRGSTEASVWRTFSDPSGTGWNTLTFNGLLPRSDVPGGRWMKIEVNGQQVFAATELNTPPDQWSEPFEIRVPFPQTATATVKFSHGQNPAWGPIFMMEYDSLQFSLETGTQMTALNAPLVIPQEEVIVANMTDSNAA